MRTRNTTQFSESSPLIDLGSIDRTITHNYVPESSLVLPDVKTIVKSYVSSHRIIDASHELLKLLEKEQKTKTGKAETLTGTRAYEEQRRRLEEEPPLNRYLI